jgi:hypothetical protein
MIKANELRIGNEVMNPFSGTTGRVTAMDISDIENGSKERQPIPLTEEWLNKAGCNIKEGVGWKYYCFIDFDLQVDLCNKVAFVQRHDEDAVPFPCQYIHQLQNIYFTLTGEELLWN